MSEQWLLLGLACGEALDGLEAVLLDVRGRDEATTAEVRLARHDGLDEQTARCARMLFSEAAHTHRASQWAKLFCQADRGLVDAAVRCGRALLEQAGCPTDRLAGAGWTGLTLHIEPARADARGAVLSAGAPAAVAEGLGTPVVGDFTAGDLARGGVGSPLNAWCDWLRLRDERLSRVVVSLGGIARVTFLPADSEACDVLGFDVGPGTLVLDALARKHHHTACDTDGAIAATGRLVEPLLNELQAHPFFQQPAPRRARPGEWLEDYLWRLQELADRHGCDPPDLMATLTELTARTVASAVGSFTERPHEVILAGGGALNIQLAGRIRSLLSPSSTYAMDRYGLGVREHAAASAALQAAARLELSAAHCHRATGAIRPGTLGAVYLP